MANIEISSEFFSIGYGSPAAGRHKSISFSRRNPLFTKASRSSVFSLDFFHYLGGLGCGGDVGGDDSWADPSDSLRDLFFPHQTSSPWTEKPSFSKSRGSSLASARGLRWRWVVAACGDFSISRAAAEVIMDGGSNRSTAAAATVGIEKL
jgi:hypothetical protein